MKTHKIFIGILALVFALPFFAAAQTGNHFGEQKFLSYHIEYLTPFGDTISSANGIDFLQNGYLLEHLDTVLPKKYWGTYPLYFSEGILQFNVVIKNDGAREFRHLKIETFQEFFSIKGNAGQALPGNNYHFWKVDKLATGQKITLDGEFFIPTTDESGLDQTHLRISHNNSSGKEKK